jgi:hypothetical protein
MDGTCDTNRNNTRCLGLYSSDSKASEETCRWISRKQEDNIKIECKIGYFWTDLNWLRMEISGGPF